MKTYGIDQGAVHLHLAHRCALSSWRGQKGGRKCACFIQVSSGCEGGDLALRLVTLIPNPRDSIKTACKNLLAYVNVNERCGKVAFVNKRVGREDRFLFLFGTLILFIMFFDAVLRK